MGTEIERKFLVKEGAWHEANATRYRQGYLSTVKERTVRVRTINNKGYLTIRALPLGRPGWSLSMRFPQRMRMSCWTACAKNR